MRESERDRERERECVCVCVCECERERERERDAEQGDRVTVLRTAALMILKLENPLESLEDRIAIHMNRLLRTPLVFSSSSLKQRSMASPSLLCVPGGGVYLGV